MLTNAIVLFGKNKVFIQDFFDDLPLFGENENLYIVRKAADGTVDNKIYEWRDNGYTPFSFTEQYIREHTTEKITSELGVHDIRYFNDQLAVKVDDQWVEIKAGSGVIKAPDTSNFTGHSAADGRSITVNWTNPTNSEFKKVVLYASTSDISNADINSIASIANKVVDGTQTSYTQSTTIGEKWYFKLFAVHDLMDAQYSRGLAINMVARDVEPPGEIINFTVMEKDSVVDLSWGNPADEDFEKVVIRYAQNTYPTSVTDGQFAYDGSAKNASITGLTNNTTYYFRAFTVDKNGNINNIEDGQCVTATPRKINNEDPTNSPGPKTLIAGTMEAGYFGLVPSSEFFAGAEIALACGITQGTLQHDTTPWLKFAYEGKVLFRPQKPIRHSILWNHINAVGCVSGTKIVSKNKIEYKVRLMRGAIAPYKYATSDRGAKGSEWNRLMLPIHEKAATGKWTYSDFIEDDIPDWGIGFTDNDFAIRGNGSAVWCQEIGASNVAVYRCMVNNCFSLTNGTRPDGKDVFFKSIQYGWAPVLEVST